MFFFFFESWLELQKEKHKREKERHKEFMRLKEFARQPIEPAHQNPYSAHTYSSPATGLSPHNSQISIPYTSIHNKSFHQQYGQNYKQNPPPSQFSQQPHLPHPYVQNQQYPYRENSPEKESLQDNPAYRIVRGKHN